MTQEMKQAFTRRISQANASALVVIVYEIALESMKEALEASPGSPEYRGHIARARSCVANLQNALKPEYAVSRNLLSLYGYASRELSRAEASGKNEGITHASSVLEGLYRAFRQVAEQDDSAPLMENAQNVYAGLTYGRGELKEDPLIGGNRGFLA